MRAKGKTAAFSLGKGDMALRDLKFMKPGGGKGAHHGNMLEDPKAVHPFGQTVNGTEPGEGKVAKGGA